MKPASPRARRATLPLGRMVSHVMLPLFRPIRNQPSGGNCRALPDQRKDTSVSQSVYWSYAVFTRPLLKLRYVTVGVGDLSRGNM